MKKLFLMTIFLAVTLAIGAQTQDAQLTQIRSQYAEAKKQVELIEKGTTPVGYGHTVVTSNYTMAANIPYKDTIHYYFHGKTDARTERYYLFPFLVTRTYTVGGTPHYEEYLYNECGDGIAFFFQKSADGETRYYWDTCADKNFFHEDIKGDRGLDEVFAARMASDIKASFDKLMNLEY